MAKKGDGITRHKKSGLFMARHTVHTPDGPKRKTIYDKTYKGVEKKLAEARGDAARGIVFDAKGETVGAFLERWLRDVVEPNKTHRTYATHRQQIRSHIIPTLGRIKLEALRKMHVDRFYADLLRSKPEGAGLAPSSVRRVHAVLHAALEEAVREDLIGRNPAHHANKPKVRQQEIEPLDATQAGTFLDAARGDQFEALYVLCLLCALRQGEALALRWSDIDERISLRRAPVAAGPPGRGQIRHARILRTEERFPSPGRASSASRERPQKAPDAPARGETRSYALRGHRARIRHRRR